MKFQENIKSFMKNFHPKWAKWIGATEASFCRTAADEGSFCRELSKLFDKKQMNGCPTLVLTCHILVLNLSLLCTQSIIPQTFPERARLVFNHQKPLEIVDNIF